MALNLPLKLNTPLSRWFGLFGIHTQIILGNSISTRAPGFFVSNSCLLPTIKHHIVLWCNVKLPQSEWTCHLSNLWYWGCPHLVLQWCILAGDGNCPVHQLVDPEICWCHFLAPCLCRKHAHCKIWRWMVRVSFGWQLCFLKHTASFGIPSKSYHR